MKVEFTPEIQKLHLGKTMRPLHGELKDTLGSNGFSLHKVEGFSY